MNAVTQGLARHIGANALAALGRVRVGIAGAGGLGSNCAMHLVRSGFTHLTLCDFDSVDASNLNRQFFFASQTGMPKVDALADNLRAIRPDLHLDLHRERLDESSAPRILAGCDAVVECLDDARAKAMLATTIGPKIGLYVGASGIAGCNAARRMDVTRFAATMFIVGDMRSSCDELPPLSPGVGMAAAMQAEIVLAHFLKEHRA
ncbi:sulfur carrier protein ThiS adenylyltransferase [Desulfobaculum xiamenense]|uniref:Sulfur carrier protein ThiS adenylyltransferase n=1 Tax=Desulfobaculum xiamenense TaxID=995050 RepID=A0A846QMJ5_9BACT|nr:sulfur carrier protein ThiS adenylyltransferase ThiF [Desulfobaculum xiamenense]NJB68407.1 sulfur carrier protein ThiS adenylyltransferase [Desulfobaculum xiamenense]